MGEAAEYAPSPSIEALAPCLKGTNDALVSTYFVGYKVQYVEVVDNEILSPGWHDNKRDVFVGKHLPSGKNVVRQLQLQGSHIAFDNRPGRTSREDCSVHNEEVACGAIFRDGKRVVSGWSTGAARVSYLESGEMLWEGIIGDSAGVRCVAVSPGGSRVVAGSTDGTARVWDMENGKQVGTPLYGLCVGAMSVAISGDERRMVSWGPYGAESTVQVWDTKRGEQVGPARNADMEDVESVVMSGDGRRMVSGSWDGTVKVRDAQRGEII